MSSMTARRTASGEVGRLRMGFWSTFVGSIGLCVMIHFAAPLFADDQFLRLVMVILFFGCLSSATWSFSQPFRDYFRARLRWQYADAGPAVLDSVERYSLRIARFAGTLSNVATVGVGLIGLGVLCYWDLLGPMPRLGLWLVWAGFAALAAVPLAALLGAGGLREALALRRQFEEEAHVAGTRLRSATTEVEERAAEAAPPVTVSGPMTFVAGGYDWNVGDFYKNVAIFGQTGTGKTVCVLNALLDGLLGATAAAGKPASALILDPKGDFRDKIGHLAAEHGRTRDLVVIDPYDPKRSIRWNPLDSDDDAMEIAGRFAAVMETLAPSGSDDTFWIESAKRLVQNLIQLLRAARPGEPPSLVEIYEAAVNDDQLEHWGRMIPDSTYDDSIDVRRMVGFLQDVWMTMPTDTRGSVRSFVSNMLGPFLTAPYDTLFAGRSTVRVADVLDRGLLLYVHMPIADREVMARVVSTFVKLEFYREVLLRLDKPRPSFFLCDEFQSFLTDGQGRGDADAFARTRQSNHANIVAFQNLSSLFKQTPRREPVLNLLGNCATKLFLRNTEKETNEYASELFGEQIEMLTATSTNISGSARGTGGSGSVSRTAQYQARIRRDAFARLAVPSREDGSQFAESIGHLASRSQVETRRMKWKVHPIGER